MEKRLKTGGRQKGTVNKATREFREVVRQLLEHNADNMSVWLHRVAADDPAKALDMLMKLAEFAAPKMSRTEVIGVDEGPPIQVTATMTPAETYMAMLRR